MTELTITGQTLTVTLKGWDKLWAFRSRLRLPLAQLVGVRVSRQERPRGMRLLGTHLPGLIVAGTFLAGGQREFWAVHDVRRTLVLELRGAGYGRVVVEVADPEGWVGRLEELLSPVGV